MKTRNYGIQILLAGLLAVAGSSCLVSSVNNEDLDTKEIYKLATGGGAGTACAQNAFRSAVHQIFIPQCGGCHLTGGQSPAHGDTTILTAYNASKSRVNFTSATSIGASSLVSKAATAGHCGGCGTSLGNNVKAALIEWGKAEAGDATTCANYATAPDAGGTVIAKPFDLGTYTPPNPNNTIIVQDGLNIFQSDVHPLLKANCAQCHIPTGLSAYAPFAVSDPTSSYKEVKPRMNFGSVDSSLIMVKAGAKNHGGTCIICGGLAGDASQSQKDFYADLKAELSNWASKENAAVQAAHVKLASNKQIVLSSINLTAKQTLSWNLNDTTPVQSDLADAVFSIDVNFSVLPAAGVDGTFRFSNPKIKAGNRAVRVKKMTIMLNNKLRTEIASYFFVDMSIPANTTKTLATSPSLVQLVPADTMGSGTAKYQDLRFEFEILQSE